LHTLVYSTFGSICYTQNDISNSDKLFSYKNNVYDVTGYKHPGGKSDLLKTVSIDASVFFEQPRYKFHATSSDVKNDLEKMYVGQLQDNCTDFIISNSTTTAPIIDTTTTFQTTKKTKKTKTTTETIPDITTIPVTITTSPYNYTTNTTSVPTFTTTVVKTPCEPLNIESNSFSIHNINTYVKIFTILLITVLV
jgi:cytochrome b involved in lipid metabolism